MPRNILNIAAGLLPIVASDLGVDQVVNFDPLTALADKDLSGSASVGYLMVLSKGVGDIIYARRQAEVDSVYPNGSVDLILSVSPFGFKVVSKWTHDKLKPGGSVLIIANGKNPCFKDYDNIIEDIAGSIYKQIEHPEPWIKATRDKVIADYPSNTTHLERATNLDTWVCFEKQ